MRRPIIILAAAVLSGIAATYWALPATAQGGGADFTRFVGVGDSLTAGVVARATVGVVSPSSATVNVRIMLVGAKMDAEDLGSAKTMSTLGDSGFVTVHGGQVVSVEADPVATLGGEHVQTGMIVQVQKLRKGVQVVASQSSIDKATGRTVNTITDHLK
jgi:hypothetical protein